MGQPALFGRAGRGRNRGDTRQIAVGTKSFYARLMPWQPALWLVAAALLPVPAVAGIATPSKGVVQSVIDGDTVVLASGTPVRLVGIQAPKLPLSRRGFKTWPLAEDAKAALAAMVLGRSVGLS